MLRGLLAGPVEVSITSRVALSTQEEHTDEFVADAEEPVTLEAYELGTVASASEFGLHPPSMVKDSQRAIEILADLIARQATSYLYVNPTMAARRASHIACCVQAIGDGGCALDWKDWNATWRLNRASQGTGDGDGPDRSPDGGGDDESAGDVSGSVSERAKERAEKREREWRQQRPHIITSCIAPAFIHAAADAIVALGMPSQFVCAASASGKWIQCLCLFSCPPGTQHYCVNVYKLSQMGSSAGAVRSALRASLGEAPITPRRRDRTCACEDPMLDELRRRLAQQCVGAQPHLLLLAPKAHDENCT